MRRAALLGSLAAGLAGYAGLACAATGLSPKHPIIGLWRVRVPGTGCFEEYRFQPNGKVHVTSGGEVADSRFEIAAEPSDAGYYHMVDTIEQDNGKPDCLGEVTPAGNEVKTFVRFDPSGNRFVICEAESLDRCIGPFERVLGQGS
jgi:hypothetical protein